MLSSHITIQEICDTNPARDAQRILRREILRAAPISESEWTEVLEAARLSTIVNDTRNAYSKSMKSISISQILDRMNTDALTILIHAMRENGSIGGLGYLKYAFEVQAQPTHWPFGVSDEFDWTTAVLHSVDVRDDDTSPTSPTSPTGYDVTDDIAHAANVLLKVATQGEMDDLQGLLDEVVALRNKPAPTPMAAAPVSASGDIPEGEPRRANAQAVFGIKDKLLDMEITVYDWDGVNPLVPTKDSNYQFDVGNLADALWAIESKSNAWLTGHTGTGKTTFVMAVCAYTGRMMMRANMDSAVERPDFVGSMSVMVDDDGNQITKFVEGFLPKAMQLPVVMLLDEYDAIRADISYVMQPVLEGGALRLMEDGGRLVHPHPDFHIMATANTNGCGDSSGMYASAVKVQSRASINRFPVFITVGYMKTSDEMALVKKIVPTLSDQGAFVMEEFLCHYRKAFEEGTVATPISPRNTITIGKYVEAFEGRLGTDLAIKRAMQMNILSTIDEGDAIAVTGIMDRITA